VLAHVVRASGVRFVMTIGAMKMLELFVGNLIIEQWVSTIQLILLYIARSLSC
jgi:hypothetical protein